MEIRIETRRTGQEIMDGLKSKWGSRKALLNDDSSEARDALFWWDLLQDKKRLNDVHTIGDIIELEAEDLRFLSSGRVDVLKHAAKHQGESLGDLAQHLGRDLANVQRDADRLVEMGLLRTEKKGRRLLVSPAGNSIQIDLLA